jgi:hypothetical protein
VDEVTEGLGSQHSTGMEAHYRARNVISPDPVASSQLWPCIGSHPRIRLDHKCPITPFNSMPSIAPQANIFVSSGQPQILHHHPFQGDIISSPIHFHAK